LPCAYYLPIFILHYPLLIFPSSLTNRHELRRAGKDIAVEA